MAPWSASAVAPARAIATPPKKGFGKTKQPEQWGDAGPIEAAVGASAVAVLRTIAGGDPKRESRGAAGFSIDVDGKKKACTLATRATKTSKQVVLTLETPPYAPKTLEDLGMPADMAGRVRELLTLENGIFLVSSPPLSGSSTAFDTVLLTADRLVRDFVSIEDSDAPPKEVPNVKPMRYSTSAGDTPVSALKKAMLGYTNKQITTAEMIVKLLELAKWVREAKLHGKDLGLSTGPKPPRRFPLLREVELGVTAELGRRQMLVKDLLALSVQQEKQKILQQPFIVLSAPKGKNDQ